MIDPRAHTPVPGGDKMQDVIILIQMVKKAKGDNPMGILYHKAIIFNSCNMVGFIISPNPGLLQQPGSGTIERLTKLWH